MKLFLVFKTQFSNTNRSPIDDIQKILQRFSVFIVQIF
eukprot:04823.XXX_66559_66672_1 [CDS] Oithona nana genome sequencing.